MDHADEVAHFATLIDRHLAPLFDRKTSEIYRRSEDDIYDEPQEFWSRLFSGIRPERIEKLPNVTQYDHSSLVDVSPVKPHGAVEAAVKAKPRDAAQD